MKTVIKLSTHAVKKHLYASNLDASVFFNRNIMNICIQKSLNAPDNIKQNGKRFELTKSFDHDIGLMGFDDKPTNKIKVIFKKTKNVTFVITAYPVI